MISFQILLSYGSYLVVVALLIDKIFNGSTKIRKQVSDAYKDRADQLDKSFKELNQKFINQGNELARMSGELGEKDKMIANLNATILNRNPALEKTLEEINKFLQKLYEKTTEISDKTDAQTEILHGQVDREHSIDLSTMKGEGNVIRIKNNKKHE